MIQGLIKDGCFIVYDEEPVPVEPAGEEGTSETAESLSESIKQLTEAVQKLDKDLNPEPLTDENGEEITEEVSTEEILEEELPVQKKDLTQMTEALERIDKTLDEMNGREKEKIAQEDVLEKERKEALKSSSQNLWTGDVYLSNMALGSQSTNYGPFRQASHDVYKLELKPSTNYVFSYTYIGPSSPVYAFRVVFYDSSDNPITGLVRRTSDGSNIETQIHFTCPSNTSYVLFSVAKDTSNITLYSDVVGRSNIVYLDENVDNHLYLTSEVENANLNDIFTIGLSIRNVLLLFMLLWLSLKVFGMIRAAVDRVMNR